MLAVGGEFDDAVEGGRGVYAPKKELGTDPDGYPAKYVSAAFLNWPS